MVVLASFKKGPCERPQSSQSLSSVSITPPSTSVEVNKEENGASRSATILPHFVPHTLLSDATGIAPVIQIMHARTLFSDGALKDGTLHPTVSEYYASLREVGISSVYMPGAAYQQAVFSDLIMPHFAKGWSPRPKDEHIGGSVFSVDEYIPPAKIGSWEEMKHFAALSQQAGVTPILDFIPNTIGVGSRFVRSHPELIRDAHHAPSEFEALRKLCESSGPPRYAVDLSTSDHGHRELHKTAVYAPRDGTEIMVHSCEDDACRLTTYLRRGFHGFYPEAWMVLEREGEARQLLCKQLGTDGNTNWADVLALDTNRHEVRRMHADLIASLSTVTPVIRADMAHLPEPSYWTEVQQMVREQGGQLPIILAEAYGSEAHRRLSARGLVVYANNLREYLHHNNMAPSYVMHSVFNDPSVRRLCRDGTLVAYSANHDDPHSSFHPREGAMAAVIASLPVLYTMLAQGQREGDPTRYAADSNVPMKEFLRRATVQEVGDPAFPAFMNSLLPLMSKAVFRDRRSEWRPAALAGYGHRDPRNVFHIVRSLDEEKVVCVVEFTDRICKDPIVLDVKNTFSLGSRTELNSYLLVDLITGDVEEASPQFELRPKGIPTGYDSHLYMLISRKKYEDTVIAARGEATFPENYWG